MARVPRGQHYGVDRRRPWTSPPSTPVPVAACRCVSACSSGKYVEITFRDGGIYRGEVSPEGKPHGQGRLQSPTADDGDSWVYEGSFKDGKRDGVGVCSWADGYHFEGEFSTGLLCGLGAMWDKGKLEWCGRWVKCEFTEGCAVPLRLIPQRTSLSDAAQQVRREHPEYSLCRLNKEGRFFIGEVNSRGQAHGQGVRFHPDGSLDTELFLDPVDARNSGRWIAGKLNGKATQRWGNGDRYDGSFKNGMFDGLGVYSWKGGRRHEGEWAADKLSGLGVQWDKDGKLAKCGRWVDDVFVESCAVPLRCLPEKRFLSAAARSASLLYPDGGYYSGQINQSNQRHGVGLMFAADGKLVDSGTWINDQLQSVSFFTQVAALFGFGSVSAASPYAAPLATTVAPSLPSATAATSASPAASSSSSSSCAAASSAPTALQLPNRKALVIGNSKYAAPVKSLQCCGNDATDMSEVLTELRFQCTRLLDASRREMTSALRTFIASLQRGDIVFLHFSGHGAESAGTTYLMPSDFGDGLLRYDAVNLNDVMRDFNRLNLDLIVIIVLDCCRANKDDGTWKGGSEGGLIARSAIEWTERGDKDFVRAPTSGQFFIAYSSDPGTVAFESHDERNGWFTGCLLLHLPTPGLHIEQVFKKTNAALELKSKQRQRAWHSSSLKEDVILLPKRRHNGIETDEEWGRTIL